MLNRIKNIDPITKSTIKVVAVQAAIVAVAVGVNVVYSKAKAESTSK